MRGLVPTRPTERNYWYDIELSYKCKMRTCRLVIGDNDTNKTGVDKREERRRRGGRNRRVTDCLCGPVWPPYRAFITWLIMSPKFAVPSDTNSCNCRSYAQLLILLRNLLLLQTLRAIGLQLTHYRSGAQLFILWGVQFSDSRSRDRENLWNCNAPTTTIWAHSNITNISNTNKACCETTC